MTRWRSGAESSWTVGGMAAAAASASSSGNDARPVATPVAAMPCRSRRRLGTTSVGSSVRDGDMGDLLGMGGSTWGEVDPMSECHPRKVVRPGGPVRALMARYD